MNEKVIGRYTIKLLEDNCISAAACVAVSPAVFTLEHRNMVEFAYGTDTEENILLAAQSCPTGAIEIYENGVKIWPL
ncbi:MAG TPA: ferredoxin [Patescibacteria group bacterium]|nr:ferredoxin [Patescibacteria group bacterium]